MGIKEMISALTLLCLVFSGVDAIRVIIPKPIYEYARGDNITLPCTFQPKSINYSVVMITWLAEDVEGQKENQIAVYYGFSNTIDIKSHYRSRLSLDVDVKKKKADLKLSSIKLEDNKLFECRVNIPGDNEGTLSATTRLVVLVAPSKPICKIQGKAEYGQNINLTCLSEEGSPKPTYKWDSRDVRNMPRIADPRTTDRGGILSLYNISKETSGYYTCTSKNKIRATTCNITLSVMPPSMNIGSTAGIIAAVVAGFILLIIGIYCCCRNKNKQEEYAMGLQGEAYEDKEPGQNGDEDDSKVRSPSEHSERNEERNERKYDDRRSDYDDRRRDVDDRRSDYDDHRRDYDDRRSDYDDRRSDYDDRRRDFDDRRSDYDDRRRDVDDRRSDYDDRRRDVDDCRSDYDDHRRDYDDRRSDYDDRRNKYNDRHERYDDDRRHDDDRRDRHHADDERYDEPYDDRGRSSR